MKLSINSRRELILFCLIISLPTVTSGQTLLTSNRNAFLSAEKIKTIFYHDKEVYKAGNSLYFSSQCKPLIEDTTDENFFELEYVGDLNKELSLKVIKKTLYNGEEYLIEDTRHCCMEYVLDGEPQVVDSTIITVNESQTTDLVNRIDLWKIKNEKNNTL